MLSSLVTAQLSTRSRTTFTESIMIMDAVAEEEELSCPLLLGNGLRLLVKEHPRSGSRRKHQHQHGNDQHSADHALLDSGFAISNDSYVKMAHGYDSNLLIVAQNIVGRYRQVQPIRRRDTSV